MSLEQVAKDLGYKTERRPIHIDELNTFEEAGACGTAAVITPIRKIVDETTNTTFSYSEDEEPGEVSTKLYQRLQAIQSGDIEDTHNWVKILDI